MLASVLVCTLLVFISTNGAPVVDFAGTNAGGYEFVFHDLHNLFLVLKDNSCYFFTAKDESDSASFGGFHAKLTTERHATWIIEHQNQSVTPSSIDEVRNIFGDRLADFRCGDKSIFVVDPLLVLATPPPGFHHHWLSWGDRHPHNLTVSDIHGIGRRSNS